MSKSVKIFLVVLFVVTVLVPVFNLGLGSLPNYIVPLLGKYICLAILAVTLDLVWGYAGILSLGHAAFFTLGGYAMGMYLMLQIGGRGVYGNAELPDFMVFLNYDHLPWFWQGFQSFPYALFMCVFVPGLLAFIFGWLAFRSRVTGVYFSIITQAMTYALMLAFFRNEMGFGGNNGLTDFKDLLGYDLSSQKVRNSLFVISAIALALTILFSEWVTRSKAGAVLEGIRDAEMRTRFLGYRVEHYKTFVFTISAMMAGIAGALYTPQVGIINPGEFAPANSIEIVIMVALGGRGTLVGAALGALIVSAAKTLFTGWFPEGWLYVLGAMFIFVTLYMPEGVLGVLKKIRSNPSPKIEKVAA